VLHNFLKVKDISVQTSSTTNQ